MWSWLTFFVALGGSFVLWGSIFIAAALVSEFQQRKKILYVGWIRAPSESMRKRLRNLGMRGAMHWEQETPAFGAFSHCETDQFPLEYLYQLVTEREIDIQIGGFTGIWKGTATQVPRHLQHFYDDKWWHMRKTGFIERHGYRWNTTPGVGYEPIGEAT